MKRLSSRWTARGSLSIMAQPESTDELALQALSTPAVGAPDALEVLVDALLEAGILPADPFLSSGTGPALDLRRRAYHWAKRRLAPLPNPTQQLVDIVTRALQEASLPLPVLGVVGPFLLRLHYVEPVDPDVLVLTHGAVTRGLPASIVVEVTRRT
jgi:hypothetical protein